MYHVNLFCSGLQPPGKANAAIFAGTDGGISRRKESTQPGIKTTNDAHVPDFVRDQTII